MKMIHMECPGHPEATLEGYLLDCAMTLGQEINRPAVIVCPGGGYVYCADSEGEPVALGYAERGFHAFILRYSTGRHAAGWAALEQVSWAVKLLRDNAEQWHIDPNKIAVCGFSAGGHLALASGTVAQHKPNAMILGYPVASAPAMEGLNFMLKLLTGKDTVTEADAEPFELISKITKQSPPAFLVATAEDGLTPYGSLAIANRYSQLGLGYELHVFQYGGHGLARADMTSANGSSRYVDPAFASWLNLSVEWMLKTFGKPEFVDKSNSKMAQYLKDLGVEIPGF